MLRISEVFQEKRDELTEQGQKLRELLASLDPAADPDAAGARFEDSELQSLALEQLSAQYDQREGGFGAAPKFPMPDTVSWVLQYWAQAARGGDKQGEALDMVMTTLTQMARGGIFDHLGGGFCRYSTDARWMIPHFEKMLYDNGQLLSLYADALRIGPDELFSDALTQTANWLLRDMQAGPGGFYASVDADSEGEEGKYYVWRREQVKKLLSDDEYLIVETLYGLDKPANFENRWNLHRYDSWRSVVQRLSLTRPAADEMLSAARRKLLAARSERTAPQHDEKILTAWNALAIKGLAKASDVLGEERWLQAAQRSADRLQAHCWQDGILYATLQQGAVQHAGYLDDYANVLDALVTLLEVHWQSKYLVFAEALADALLANFYDAEQGGFFFTAHQHETLIHRPKPTMDDALPAGNAVAASALMKLGHLLARSDYLDAAYGTLNWARRAMEQHPAGHCRLLSALAAQDTNQSVQLVLRGPAAEVGAWRNRVQQAYRPWVQCFAIPYEAAGALPPYLPALVSLEEQQRCSAFVCRGLSCDKPVHTIEEVLEAIA